MDNRFCGKQVLIRDVSWGRADATQKRDRVRWMIIPGLEFVLQAQPFGELGYCSAKAAWITIRMMTPGSQLAPGRAG